MGDNFFNHFFGQTGGSSPFNNPPFNGNFNPGGNMNDGEGGGAQK